MPPVRRSTAATTANWRPRVHAATVPPVKCLRAWMPHVAWTMMSAACRAPVISSAATRPAPTNVPASPATPSRANVVWPSMVTRWVMSYATWLSHNLWFSVPPTEAATLTLLSAGDIRRLNTSVSANDPNKLGNVSVSSTASHFIFAFEVGHRNRTLCTLQVIWSEMIMLCQRIDDANVNWTLPISGFIAPQQCEYIAVLAMP